MKIQIAATLIALITFLGQLSAREYGGKWDDESIREFSLKYINETKERFAKRAARISTVLENSTGTVEYRKLTDPQQAAYDKFLKDRLGERDRDALLRLILQDLENARLKLVEEEKKASAVWEKLPKAEKQEKAALIKGEIYGTEVTASNLGVLLDNSPSMRPYLEAVREEIAKSFPNTQYRESAGSGIQFEIDYYSSPRRKMNDAWYYGEIPDEGVNPFDPMWHQGKILVKTPPHYRQVDLERNPASALHALINLQKVDTIYWFCDFEDDNDPAAVKIIADAIKANNVKLYVHSSRRRPDKEIQQIIEDSGGEIIRKRIR
ncbi:MAG: hypothetical protein HKN23_12795 [Verrucomicrobiales bacterium]|nr:hypothetical protein [Verrucomicrobiales bacterium]